MAKGKTSTALVVFLILLISCSGSHAGKSGTVILGGGGFDSLCATLLKKEAKGGRIVFIPTAAPDEELTQEGMDYLRQFVAARGFPDAFFLHTRDRMVADSEEFASLFRGASAVWFLGGRQWRLTDAYLNTLTQKEIIALFERGGVVGGNSAGATALGSFMIRGDTRSNEILIGDHTEGFGLVKKAVIDQHVISRGRENDLAGVIRAHHELTGIGLDEISAVIIKGNRAETFGGKVLIHKWRGEYSSFEYINPASIYDLDGKSAVQ